MDAGAEQRQYCEGDRNDQQNVTHRSLGFPRMAGHVARESYHIGTAMYVRTNEGLTAMHMQMHQNALLCRCLTCGLGWFDRFSEMHALEAVFAAQPIHARQSPFPLLRARAVEEPQLVLVI